MCGFFCQELRQGSRRGSVTQPLFQSSKQEAIAEGSCSGCPVDPQPMALFLVGAALMALGIPGATLPVLEAPSTLAPRDVARMAVEEYNEATGTQGVFRLLKLRNTHKTKFDWGVHFSMNFTVKETQCRKTTAYNIAGCKYKPSGLLRECSAEVSVLNFMQDSPLTSVNCVPLQRTSNPSGRNPKPASRLQAVQAPPQIYVEHYFPSAFSTAALMATEEE